MIGDEARIALNDALTPIWNAAGLGDEKHDAGLDMLVHRVADYIEVRQRLAALVPNPSMPSSPVAPAMLIKAAALLWSGGPVPDWRENEYIRGQVETISDVLGSPFSDERDWEDVKDYYADQIRQGAES